MLPRASSQEEPLPRESIMEPPFPAEGSNSLNREEEELIDVESLEDEESPETRRRRLPERKIPWGFKHPLERMRLENLEGKSSTESRGNDPSVPLSQWEQVLKNMVDDPATHSLPQIFHNEDRRAIALGTVHMALTATIHGAPADLRVATYRETCGLHVTAIDEAQDEPDWKSFWNSVSNKTPPVQYDEFVIPSTASSSPEIQYDPGVELGVEVKVTSLYDIHLERMVINEIYLPNDDAEIIEEIETEKHETVEERHMIINETCLPAEDAEKIKQNEAEQGEKETQKEDLIQPVIVPSTTAYSSRRLPTRTAILIPVSDAPAPPTRGRGRKRAPRVFPTGKQPIPQDFPVAVPKRKYTRKSALSESPTSAPATSPAVESPIHQSPTRGRKRNTMESSPISVPGISTPKTRRGRMMVAEDTVPEVLPNVVLKIGQPESDVGVSTSASIRDKSEDLLAVIEELKPIEEAQEDKKGRRPSGKNGTMKHWKEKLTTAEPEKAKETSSLESTKTFLDLPTPRTKSKRREKKQPVSPTPSPEFFTPEEIPIDRKELIDDTAGVDNTCDDNYFYEESCSSFSAPPEQYQFAAPRRTKIFVPIDDDDDIQILSPPRRVDSDDIQIIEPKRRNEDGEIKHESEEEFEVPVQVTITDAEYDEDGEDDPPYGAELIEVCDYLQLDAENEICEDFVPFPPETTRVDAGVFAQFIRALSLNIYNIRLPHMNYRYIHYPIEFIQFFQNVKLAEIHGDVDDPLVVVNEALCNMSVQATHLLTHQTDKNAKKLVTSSKFKELIKMFLSDRNDLRDEMAKEAFGTIEGPEYENLKSIWDPLMKTILLRICDSLLSLARETNSWEAPITDNVLRRRFEAILIGWRNFILRGGILKTIFNLRKLPEKVKKVFYKWFQRQDAVLEDIKVALEAGAVSRTETLMNELESSGIAMRWNECRRNVSREQSELHMYKCNCCKLFFSQEDLLKAHKQVHDYTPHLCEICFLGFAYKVSLRIHALQRHFKEILTGELKV